ncbi:hypothetical protein H5410_041886 [Solanum commersonii]|uniref:Uncharacterized protein n=1 Tax=Solanum commersonii TaxID=4109 RepID=A0A9J5XVW8_SOLCO|nr:hypothetical protein H5410_041886 [Solanum commersonii]
MISRYSIIGVFFLVLVSIFVNIEGRSISQFLTQNTKGTKWAVLVAGSNEWINYRHQADVCHAYQIMKAGGLKDENIIVFMYDDIANNTKNPRPGVIINNPHGHDVYKGVPKAGLCRRYVNAKNFFNVILANKSGVVGGSEKVLKSGPNDHIFIYYADHGGPGIIGNWKIKLSILIVNRSLICDSLKLIRICIIVFVFLLLSAMPNEVVYAHDLVNVLKKKHASGTYDRLVFYLEACESGSMFDGLLPEGLDIYVRLQRNLMKTVMAHTVERVLLLIPVWVSVPPLEFKGVCLGDLYSVAWMEDSDVQDRKLNSVHRQYSRVAKRTAANLTYYNYGSHVQEYGDKVVSFDPLAAYMGETSKNHIHDSVDAKSFSTSSSRNVDQRMQY